MAAIEEREPKRIRTDEPEVTTKAATSANWQEAGETEEGKTCKTANKADEAFRTYDAETQPRVYEHYKMMRENHTVAFYDRMEAKYSFDTGGRRRMTIKQAFVELENYVDASDPDLSLPNLIHLLQTAEGIRKDGHPDWFQLVGLLHDMGKIMFLWGTGEDGQDGLSSDGAQWALGGDTFVVGCAIPDCAVFPELNSHNPDMQNEKLNTPTGMYEPGCGLDALKFAWGHDEYMWRMLTANGCTIPKEGLDMIRYHSAYPMHDKGAYKELLRAEDEPRLEWVRCFNQYDLYTKDEENVLEPEKLWPYYESLLEKYGLSGELMW